MNNQRRTQLKAINVKILDLIQDLNFIKDEEQEYFDNMPESFQMAEKGDKSQEAIDNIDGALDILQEAIDFIDEATN